MFYVYIMVACKMSPIDLCVYTLDSQQGKEQCHFLRVTVFLPPYFDFLLLHYHHEKTSGSHYHRLSCFRCYAASAFLDWHLQKLCRVKPFSFFPVRYSITETRKVIQCGKVLDKGCEYGLVFRLISCV